MYVYIHWRCIGWLNKASIRNTVGDSRKAGREWNTGVFCSSQHLIYFGNCCCLYWLKLLVLCTVKNICISTDILASLFRWFMNTNVYGTGSVKIWKTRHKISICRYMYIFYSTVVDDEKVRSCYWLELVFFCSFQCFDADDWVTDTMDIWPV